MSKWSEFYAPKMNPESRALFKKKYWPYLSELMLVMTGHKANTIIEAGCGTALVTKFLIESTGHGHHVCLDIDKDVLALAEQNHPETKSRDWTLRHDFWDITNPLGLKADLLHSHGVLEHFDDDKIQTIVGNMRETAKVVYAFVPSDKYDYKSYGDERLMSSEEWKAICSPSEIQEFNDGKDLILKWRN